jgi:hypothetical protein
LKYFNKRGIHIDASSGYEVRWNMIRWSSLTCSWTQQLELRFEGL